MNDYEEKFFFSIKGTIIPHKHDFATIVKLSSSSLRLWHYRFGHLNFSLIKIKPFEMV
jgi:hypothetical protein